MPTERIGGPPPSPCRHREHNPPQHQVFEAGEYKHTCPACGHVTFFTVRKPVWDGSASSLFSLAKDIGQSPAVRSVVKSVVESKLKRGR